MILNNEAKIYYKKIKKLITFSSKDKDEFLSIIEKRLIDYCSDVDDIYYDKLVAEFGTPNEVACSYVESLDTDQLLKQIKIKRAIQVMFVIICICILSYTVYNMYNLNRLYNEAKQSLDIHEETTIIEIE